MSVTPFHRISLPGTTKGLSVARERGGPGREGVAEVHGAAHRMPDHAVRAVDAPRKAAAVRARPERVFLGVVEVRYFQPRLVFVEGGVARGFGATGLEWTEVVLSGR